MPAKAALRLQDSQLTVWPPGGYARASPRAAVAEPTEKKAAVRPLPSCVPSGRRARLVWSDGIHWAKLDHCSLRNLGED
jgi:hypothetical protein